MVRYECFMGIIPVFFNFFKSFFLPFRAIEKNHTYHRDLIREMEDRRGYPALIISQHFCSQAMLEKKQEEYKI